MTNKVETKRMGNFDMAAAADRVKAFWELYPDGKIETTKHYDEQDSRLVFISYVWKKKSDYLEIAKIPGVSEKALLGSADSNGTAKQADGKEAKKDFEKLETISVGRALAFIGFSKDGTIASSEEMEEFKSFINDKFEENVSTAIEFLEDATDMKDLQNKWIALDGQVKGDERVENTKDNLKNKFLEVKSKTKKENVK